MKKQETKKAERIQVKYNGLKREIYVDGSLIAICGCAGTTLSAINQIKKNLNA